MPKNLLSLVKTEPALIASAVQALLGVIVAFGGALTSGQVAAILAVSAAILTAVTAAATRPLQVAAFTGLVTAAGVLVASFGVHLGSGEVAAVNFLITAVFALLTRAQVTPVATLNAAKPQPARAPTQPVPVSPSKL